MFGAQNFWWGVFGADGGYDTHVIILLAWGRGCLCGNPAFPADLGPSHLLLPWHLLHGSLKRFGKHQPDGFWVFCPRWRERMLNELWIFCFYFPSQVSQQVGELGPLPGSVVVLWCLQLSLTGCGFFPVLYCQVFVGKVFFQTIPSSIFWGIAAVLVLPSPPGVFPLGCRGFSWIPGLWQQMLPVVSVLQETAPWSWGMRLTRAQTTEK